MVRSGMDRRRLRGIDFDPIHGRSDHADWHKGRLVEIDALVALDARGSRGRPQSVFRIGSAIAHP